MSRRVSGMCRGLRGFLGPCFVLEGEGPLGAGA